MKDWQEDLLAITQGSSDENEVFEHVRASAMALGFDYCAYGLQIPYPLSRPGTVMLSNYPKRWRDRYSTEGYQNIDPLVRHCRQSIKPVIWSDVVFAEAPEFWSEAKSFGLNFGWAQSHLDPLGCSGMLALSRSSGALTESELQEQELKMRWLTNVAHIAFSSIFNTRKKLADAPQLTKREVEVLKWTGDGKSAIEISNIMMLSKSTIDFHIKNAISKLQTANKTSAVVRAMMLGLLT